MDGKKRCICQQVFVIEIKIFNQIHQMLLKQLPLMGVHFQSKQSKPSQNILSSSQKGFSWVFKSPSIKDVNRKYRGDIETEGEFWILKIPSSCNELLKISSFKSSSLIFRWRNIKILHIFRDGRKRVLLLYWQRMQNILFCAWFFEIRNNSKIIWGSPRRQYKIIFHEIHVSWKTWR